MHDAESILWKNEDLWFPYNEKLNRLGRTFLSRINQADLGISLGGFTVITKTLLLTVGWNSEDTYAFGFPYFWMSQ